CRGAGSGREAPPNVRPSLRPAGARPEETHAPPAPGFATPPTLATPHPAAEETRTRIHRAFASLFASRTSPPTPLVTPNTTLRNTHRLSPPLHASQRSLQPSLGLRHASLRPR